MFEKLEECVTGSVTASVTESVKKDMLTLEGRTEERFANMEEK